MEISSANQAYVFLAMVLCGALCTGVFDIFRAIRRYKNSATGVIVFQDIVFWIIELFIVYMVAFRLNYARVRAYEIIALVIGSAIYFVTLSDYVIKFMMWQIGLVAKVFGFLMAPLLRVSAYACQKLKDGAVFVKNKCSIPTTLKLSVRTKISAAVEKTKTVFKPFWLKTGQKDNKLQN